MDRHSDPGEYVQIRPYERIQSDAPADYSARLAAALRTLGPRYCLAQPINGRIPGLIPAEIKPQMRLVRKT
jgi:hypothetical protein